MEIITVILFINVCNILIELGKGQNEKDFLKLRNTLFVSKSAFSDFQIFRLHKCFEIRLKKP